LEELEPRWVPADYYLVRGVAGAQTSLLFHFNLRNTLFHDEIGVYTVTDDQGRVNNILPGAAGYAAAALSTTNSQVLFSPSQGVGTDKVLSFNGGTLLGFYLVQNGTSANARANNPQNQLDSVGAVTFFSFDAADPDHFRHTSSNLYGDGSAVISFNDQQGGGNRSFQNAVFTVGVAAGSASSLPGLPGQQVPVSFTLNSRKGNFHDEIGVFSVDSIDGSINGLKPGQAGWVQAAIGSANANQHVLFTRDQGGGAVNPVILPGGGMFGIYLVQDSTTANVLASNPSDLAGQLPQVFFSFVAANPDGFQHLRWLDATHFVWEDETGGGDQDFADVTGTVTVGTPQGTATTNPSGDKGGPTVSTPINDVSVARNAADTTLDLAANFTDPDIVDGNTTVTLNTSSGPINLTLLDRTAPQTVANFVDYVNNGSYNNSIFHRLANLGGSGAPQIIQGGGFALQTDPTTMAVTNITSIPQGPAVANEFNANHPDTVGTIAMAKLGGNPNSATNQFFFNLTDNSQTLGGSNNGGFTVFGNVDATGQSTLNTLVQLDSVSDQSQFNGAFNTIPLPFFQHGNNDPNFPTDTTAQNYDVINSVTLHQNDALTYHVMSNTNPGLVTATVTNERLTLHYTPNMSGTAVITVQATDKAGNTTQATFRVNVA
jgi:cyclophilin family peptidyl-prolyl cis-trans isomerase